MNAELTNTRKRTRLDRKFDRLRDAEEAGKLGKSKTSRAVRKMLENRLAVIGLVVFAIILISCLLAPLISPYDPLTTDLRAMTQPPSLQHLFGTDKLGRDVFSRTLYGGRLSILIGLGSALGAAVIGVLLGCYGGYKGGLFDKIVLRLSEIFMSFPQLILVMMLGTIFGRGLWNLIFIFILTGWGGVYRQARAKMLSLREEEYVQSMRAFGLSDFVIAYKHMLPNAIGPVVVNLTLSTAMFILDEAAMSFLGRSARDRHLGQYPQRRPGPLRHAELLVAVAAGGNCRVPVRHQHQLHRRRTARFHRPHPAGIREGAIWNSKPSSPSRICEPIFTPTSGATRFSTASPSNFIRDGPSVWWGSRAAARA